MAITANSLAAWDLNTYTAATWTDLVAGTANGEIVNGINITNLNVGTATVQIRKTNSGGTSLSTILPATSLTTGTAQALNINPIALVSSQKLQIYCDVTGVEFNASGLTMA